jgi:hypothetical protein
MVKSVSEILNSHLKRATDSKSPSAKKVASVIMNALDIEGSLSQVRDPILKRANDEQRNDAWRDTEINKAFGAKLKDIARMQHDMKKLVRIQEAGAPKIAPLDTTNLLAVMETVAVAQRIGSMPREKLDKLSPAEKTAAVRSPLLSGISSELAGFWHDELVRAEQPEKFEAYKNDQAILGEATQALNIVTQSLQREAGFTDSNTGLPGPSWSSFEREHLAPLRKEMEAVDATAAKQRNADAVVALEKSLDEARARLHRSEMAALRAL